MASPIYFSMVTLNITKKQIIQLRPSLVWEVTLPTFQDIFKGNSQPTLRNFPEAQRPQLSHADSLKHRNYKGPRRVIFYILQPPPLALSLQDTLNSTPPPICKPRSPLAVSSDHILYTTFTAYPKAFHTGVVHSFSRQRLSDGPSQESRTYNIRLDRTQHDFKQWRTEGVGGPPPNPEIPKF
jgi:hypothetical protein